MTSCAALLDGVEPEEHLVQLYGSDDRLLTRNVARYLSEGLRRGDGLLMIATAEHRTTVTRLLRDEAAYPRAVLEGRLVFLDAERTLARFMVDGSPDPERFRCVIGEALEGVRSRGVHTGVRAYGEMVGLLWKAGERAAAVRLEELWNDLLRQTDVSLFCAYPIDIFGPDFEPGTIDPLLCTHTHLVPIDAVLETALDHAMDDVLGSRADEIRGMIQSNHRPAWGVIPRAEAVVLWLRNNLPGSANQILSRAREHYQAATSRV
jgi:hypothetical protein